MVGRRARRKAGGGGWLWWHGRAAPWQGRRPGATRRNHRVRIARHRGLRFHLFAVDDVPVLHHPVCNLLASICYKAEAARRSGRAVLHHDAIRDVSKALEIATQPNRRRLARQPTHKHLAHLQLLLGRPRLCHAGRCGARCRESAAGHVDGEHRQHPARTPPRTEGSAARPLLGC